jgi:hypothetical protein
VENAGLFFQLRSVRPYALFSLTAGWSVLFYRSVLGVIFFTNSPFVRVSRWLTRRGWWTLFYGKMGSGSFVELCQIRNY